MHLWQHLVMLFTNHNKTLSELLRIVDSSTLPIAIQCGHFALNYDEKSHRLFPGIYQDVLDPEKRELIRTHPYMADFPLETWKIGIALAAHAKQKGKSVSLVLLVNDWQWVPRVESGTENPLRKQFYLQPEIPPSYLTELEKNGLTTDIISPFKYADETSSNAYFLSETQLRSRFASHYSASCELNNQCAQEYVPLVLQLQKEGAGLFVSFVPRTCMNAVEAGTEKCRSDFGVSMKIVNIYANGIFKDHFWEQTELTSTE